MSLQLDLRRALDVTIVPHPAFVTQAERLTQLLQDHQDGLAPGVEVMIGPSRIGKSEILQRLVSQYPERRENGRLIKPVLFVSIPPGTAPKDLPLSVIQALGVPVPRERSRAGVLAEMMLQKLELAQTMAILFDETSHLVDVGSRIQPTHASDWFKALFDKARVSIVMAGVPRLTRLFDSNPQFRGRSPRPLELMPYRWDRADERKIFAGCAQAFLRVFESHACPVHAGMNTDALMRQLYAVSVGNIGLLANFFKALAREARVPAPLDLQALLRASQRIHLPAQGLLKPFTQSHIPDDFLLQLLATELAIYDITLPIDSPIAALAAHRHEFSVVPT